MHTSELVFFPLLQTEAPFDFVFLKGNSSPPVKIYFESIILLYEFLKLKQIYYDSTTLQYDSTIISGTTNYMGTAMQT